MAVPGCRAVNAERSALELPVGSADGSALVVRVALGPAFPGEAPSMVVSPPIRHPWVDISGSISPPSLFSWGQNKKVRLASVLLQVREELGSRLRTPAHPQPPSMAGPRLGPSPTGVPEVPGSFPALARMPTDQLVQAVSDLRAFASLLEWTENQLQMTKVGREFLKDGITKAGVL